MLKPEISLFHHPTTTVLVDDSEEFLYSLALGVDRLPFRSFSNPSEGLVYVNEFRSAYDVPAEERAPAASNSMSTLLAQVDRKLSDHNRFAEPSVLVVDYSMPGMNGLELCSRITNPNIKKVLLTGVADEKIAINALNTELIDFYISKREPSLSQRLRHIISHLETRYFQDLFGWGKDREVRRLLPQLFDPAFADFFEETVESLEIVEHYPLMHCGGFRLINGYGVVNHLVVYREDELAERVQTDLAHLPQVLHQQVQNFELIPYRFRSAASGPIGESELFTPKIIEGDERYYCALVADHRRAGLASRTTYHQFLKTPPVVFREKVLARRQ